MRTKPCACLNCGHRLTATGTPEEGINLKPGPNEGDYTVCVYCSHLMVFKADLSVRNPTSGELIAAAGDKEILKVMKFAHAFREHVKNEQKKNG